MTKHIQQVALILFVSVCFIQVANGQDTTVTVTATGQVGIGTSTPGATLDVNGDMIIRAPGFTGDAGGASEGLEIRGQAGTFQPALSLDNGTQQWSIVSWNDNALRFVKATGSTFTPFSISNNSFSNALVIGQNGVGVGMNSPSEMLDVNGNIAVSGTVDGVDISELKSSYTQLGNLNQASVNVTNSWTQLNIGSGKSFTKNHADTEIEVHVNSNFTGGTFAGGASGIQFQVRVDGNAANIDNLGVIRQSNGQDFISLLGVFTNLPAGSHTVSIWARVNSGSSSSVVVDPGGWGGRIIVKESW